MASAHKYLVVIAGPTAVGKTKLSIALAKFYNSVIISADSRQFYRVMNIGTAKPSESELALVKHYFINNKWEEWLIHDYENELYQACVNKYNSESS